MKILTVVGARPQFVKAAAVSRVFSQRGIEEVLLHTGQHFDHNMSQVFFDEMQIPTPKYNLDIHGLTHGAMTGRMLEGIEGVIMQEKPNLVMVYGDTNSTFAGALAAKKLHTRVAHVEAGLRSFNMRMPEEINRILTDRISDWLFCPTENAVENLKLEGFDNIPAMVLNVGDVMQDAALFYSKISQQKSTIASAIELNQTFVLATIHRQENTDSIERLSQIIDGLNLLNKEMQVIVPLHPRTREYINKTSIAPEFTIIDPVGYFDMIELLKRCSLVITDSGGLQKEAFFFAKPCVTLRNETEWVELVENGFNILSGANSYNIYSMSSLMLEGEFEFDVDLYGNGKASEQIADALLNYA
jgi:UDP-GlcNAc3NAcA epimerase